MKDSASLATLHDGPRQLSCFLFIVCLQLCFLAKRAFLSIIMVLIGMGLYRELFGRCGSGCGNQQDFINASITMWTLTRITVGVFADTSTRVGRLERVFEKGIMEIHLKVDRDRKEVPTVSFHWTMVHVCADGRLGLGQF